MFDSPDLPDATPRERGAVERTRALATLLDEAVPVPGTGRRVGIDPLVGLLPVAGDLVTGVLGLYVVAEAAYAGAPPALLGRMLLNLGADIAIGTLPVVGDVFDALWKANVRNVDLLESHIAGEN